MKRVRDYIDKDKMDVSEGDMTLTFKNGKGEDAVDKLEEIEGKDGNIKGCDYVVESVEADVDDPSQAYVKIKVGTPKVETLIKNVLKANKVLGNVSDIDADFGKGEAEPKAKKAGKKVEGGEEKAEQKQEQKAEQPAAKKSFKESVWEKKSAKKADSVNNENNTDMEKIKDENQPALIDFIEMSNGNCICIWNMMGWWYKLTEFDNNTETHKSIGKEAYGSLEEAKAAAEEFANGGVVADSKKISDAEGIKQPKQNETIDFNKGGLNFSVENVPLNGDNGYFILSSEDGKISGYRSKYGDFYGGYKTPDDALKKIVAKVNEHVNLSKSVSDSKKISDAEEKPLNGMLMIAFNDGTEEEMIAEVKKHENEQGDSNGIQYETYSVDEQDGVALVDLCAVGVKDANEFVKALLKAWGVLDNVADVDFDVQTEEEYKEEQGEEVSDSRKIKDSKTSKVYLGTVPEGYYFNLQGKEWVVVKHNDRNETVICESTNGERKEFQEITLVNMYINDSCKVEDMTESAQRGEEVSDSKKIKDARPLKEQNIWISFKEYAQDILDKAKNDEEWYVKTYPNFRWYGVYEDGVPMTAEVYSNGGDSWSFEVYLANELEEMMLNVMQMPPSDSYLRFGGEDYVDEGRTPNAISFEDFFNFYADNLW